MTTGHQARNLEVSVRSRPMPAAVKARLSRKPETTNAGLLR